MATTTVEAVRGQFTALRAPVAFFDGPGGTQVPDSVVDAIAEYLHTSNANLGGAFATSRASDAVVDGARADAARFLGATPDEVIFGANMTTLNFALSRTAARGWEPGDEIVVTELDHDANVSPWLELAHDLGLVVRFCELDGDCRLDLGHLRSLLSSRTRVVAFPWASNGVGVVTPVADVVALAHEAGALAWVDAVHYAPHGPIDVTLVDADVLLCSPYKFYGPHLGLAFGKRELLERWRPYKVRPAPDVPLGHRFETGTQPHELFAGFSAVVAYLDSVGWNFVRDHETELGARFLDGLPASWRLHGPATMDDRVPTFAITSERVSPAEAAAALAGGGFAVWHGNYYALEVMRHLGLADGAVRVGIVHTNTADEVDRLLAALAEIG
ncbi:MAG: cysteine desulfurase-like protein [Actinobacteria bacterium]|nr:cysteine desulfurase-like protein [Actinomycetota bacterium]